MSNHPFLQLISKNISRCSNCLCIGLDPNYDLLPPHIEHSMAGLESFFSEIIEVVEEKEKKRPSMKRKIKRSKICLSIFLHHLAAILVFALLNPII